MCIRDSNTINPFNSILYMSSKRKKNLYEKDRCIRNHIDLEQVHIWKPRRFDKFKFDFCKMCKFQERPPQNNIQHSFIIRFLIEARILFTFIQFYKYFRVAKWMRSVTDKMFLFSLKDNSHCVNKFMACIQEQCCFDFQYLFFLKICIYQYMCTPKIV